jgi:hypothetical protein
VGAAGPPSDAWMLGTLVGAAPTDARRPAGGRGAGLSNTELSCRLFHEGRGEWVLADTETREMSSADILPEWRFTQAQSGGPMPSAQGVLCLLYCALSCVGEGGQGDGRGMTDEEEEVDVEGLIRREQLSIKRSREIG